MAENGFGSFPAETFAFLAGIAATNEKAWFDANRRLYEAGYVAPSRALVETLETATFWSNLDALRTAVTNTLTETLTGQGTPPVVLCHISHVYETGASLYFTVLCAQGREPLAQWAAAKAAANAAIRAAGAATTHNHGVGTDHRAAYHEEVGPLAVEALRAVKRTLDPAGILNPGILL